MALAASHLVAMPLAAWERDGLAAALQGAGLPTDDLAEPGRLFWRFETAETEPVGFGGLEILHGDALLRSIVTLPPLRKRGIGAAIVASLEEEARQHRLSQPLARVSPQWPRHRKPTARPAGTRESETDKD